MDRLFLPIAFCLLSGGVKAQLPDYSRIVDAITPCVVSIIAAIGAEDSHPVESLGQTPLGFAQMSNELSNTLTLQSGVHFHSGSGITYREDGYLVTNNHIVQGALDIVVTLSNGLVYRGSVVAADSASDLAVIKIAAEGLPVCPFLDNEDEVRAGQYILGFGAPFSLSGTVTEGIISYVNRPIPVMGATSDHILFIQTDLEINPGNSGGPIVSRNGQIIGINSHLLNQPGSNLAGVAFAIPMALVERVVNQLIRDGFATRGWIGVAVVNVPPDIETVRSLGLVTPTGALVQRVVPGSPAGTAGVRVGDVIVAVDHTVIRTRYELDYEIGLKHENDILHLTIIRNGRYFSTDAITAGIFANIDTGSID